MKKDAMWQAFARTGDPVYYLLHKSLEEKKKPEGKDKSRLGELPRPED